MRRPRPVPEPLLGRAFHRNQAIELGVSPRMLEHPRFVELLPRVYRHTDTVMTPSEWVNAGRLVLPSDAHPSHLTRFISLGLDYGPFFPMHFTVGRDHHISLERIFLHRTVHLPPASEHGLSVVASFVAAASMMSLLDVVKVGDWLLHRGHLTHRALTKALTEESWRPGTEQVVKGLQHLEPRSRSLPESETRVLLIFAGLPAPASNVDLYDGATFLGCGDLVYAWLKLILEYEGRQHALDAAQFQRDIHRYRGFRENDLAYLQITRAMLHQPRTLVTTIHRAMVQQGYDGPAPTFGPQWQSLFREPDPQFHHAGAHRRQLP